MKILKATFIIINMKQRMHQIDDVHLLFSFLADSFSASMDMTLLPGYPTMQNKNRIIFILSSSPHQTNINHERQFFFLFFFGFFWQKIEDIVYSPCRYQCFVI